MDGVLEEAYELVNDGMLDHNDFREFTFTNPVILHAGMPRYRADVGVKHGRIATIGRISESALDGCQRYDKGAVMNSRTGHTCARCGSSAYAKFMDRHDNQFPHSDTVQSAAGARC